jgi:hypothetical protein
MGQLYWDLTTKDLRERLTELVNENGIDEQLLVQGIVAFLDYHFASHATPESAERARRNCISTIEKLERELTLPIEQRQQELTDAEIQDLITKMNDLSEGGESRRQEAKAALESLREVVAEVFTEQFWHDFLWERFRRFEE